MNGAALLTQRLSSGRVQSAPNKVKMITCVAELDCVRICDACAVRGGRAPVDRPTAAARLRYLPDSAVHAQIDLQLLGQNSQLSLPCVLLALRHAAEVVGEAAPVPRPAAADQAVRHHHLARRSFTKEYVIQGQTCSSIFL